jgi:hypothetical protein
MSAGGHAFGMHRHHQADPTSSAPYGTIIILCKIMKQVEMITRVSELRELSTRDYL